MPSGPWSCVTGIMSRERGGGGGSRLVVGCRGLKREIQMFKLYSFYIWASIFPGWSSSFSVEWNISHSVITVQLSLVKDTETVGFMSSMTSEFLKFSIQKVSRSGFFPQCVKQKVFGRSKLKDLSDSTNNADTWKKKQTLSGLLYWSWLQLILVCFRIKFNLSIFNVLCDLPQHKHLDMFHLFKKFPQNVKCLHFWEQRINMRTIFWTF